MEKQKTTPRDKSEVGRNAAPRTVHYGNRSWEEQSLGWIEEIDEKNDPALSQPVNGTGERIGCIFRDMRNGAIVLSVSRTSALFSGNAILHLNDQVPSRPTRRKARAPKVGPS